MVHITYYTASRATPKAKVSQIPLKGPPHILFEKLFCSEATRITHDKSPSTSLNTPRIKYHFYCEHVHPLTSLPHQQQLTLDLNIAASGGESQFTLLKEHNCSLNRLTQEKP